MNERMQTDWNTSQQSDWTFRILEAGIPGDVQLVKEAAWISSSKAYYNVARLSTQAQGRMETIERAIQLREQGMRLRHIAQVTHRSLGWVSSILKRYERHP